MTYYSDLTEKEMEIIKKGYATDKAGILTQRLLFLIAIQKMGNYNGNQRAYLHRLGKELF